MGWYFVLARLVHIGCQWSGLLWWHNWCIVTAAGLVFVLALLVHIGCQWFGLLWWHNWCIVTADGLVFCTSTPGAHWLSMVWSFVLAQLVHSHC